LKAVLCAGLYPNIFKLSEDSVNAKQPTFTNAKETARLNPSSINYHLPVPPQYQLLIYHTKTKASGSNSIGTSLPTLKILTSTVIRDSTFVTPLPVLLFGGKISVQHDKQLITIDDWLAIKASPKTAVIFKELRHLIDAALMEKIKRPNINLTETNQTLIKMILNLCANEIKNT
jgi:hypothetical protein